MQVQDVADFFGKPCQELPNFMSHSLIEQGLSDNVTRITFLKVKITKTLSYISSTNY